MKHIISSENGSRWITLSNNKTFNIESVSDLNSIVEANPSEDWKTILKDIHRARTTHKPLLAKGVLLFPLVFAVSVIGTFYTIKNTSAFSAVDLQTTSIQPSQLPQPVVGSCSQSQQKPSGIDTSKINKSLSALDNMKAKSQEVKDSLISPATESLIESELSSEQYSFGYN